MMKSRILLSIILLHLPYLLFSQSITDSVFHQSDFAVAGEIIDVKGTAIEDLGTEVFMVSLKIDTIYKQNTHLKFPIQTIFWSVSNLRYSGQSLQEYINQYLSRKYIFLLSHEHIRGGGSELDSLHIIPMNVENHLRAIQLDGEEKIRINRYEKENSCNKNCFFCRAVYNENWSLVRRIIDPNDNNPNFKIEKHRCVKYVVPIGEVLASLPTWGTKYVCFRTKRGEQIKALTYQIGYYQNIICFLHFENVNYYDLKRFEDGTQYELQKLEAYRTGMIWEAEYDTISFPETIPVCLPEPEYIRLWNIYEYHRHFLENDHYVAKYSKEYIDHLKKNKLIYNLCLLSLHRSLDVKTWSVQALAD